MTSDRRVDLREGFRVHVGTTIIPRGQYYARLQVPKTSRAGRTTWKDVGPNVIAEHADTAALDLLNALNTGALPGIEAIA